MCVYYYQQYLTQYFIIWVDFGQVAAGAPFIWEAGIRQNCLIVDFLQMSKCLDPFPVINLCLRRSELETAAKLFLPSDIVGGNCRRGNYIEDGL